MEQMMELTVIDKSLEVFKGGSAILIKHKSRAEKAMKVAGSILQQWEQVYAIEDPETKKNALAVVDKRSNDFLANCGVAKTEMEESRKAITQLMDMIKKMFIEEEARVDPKKSDQGLQIQTRRNQYAKELLDQQERDRKAAELKAAKGKEEAEIRAYIRNAITQKLLNYLAEKKQSITGSFNKITLDVFDEKENGLKNMAVAFPVSKLGEIIRYEDPRYILFDFSGYNTIRTEEQVRYNFDAFYIEYARQISELKQSLVDQLPSKKEELVEQKRIADKAEEDRLAEIKRQQEAERIRQDQIANANKAQKEKLEAQAKIAREQEQERLKEMEEKAAREKKEAADLQLQREQEDALRLQQEAERASNKAKEDAELQRAAGTALALFDQAAETAEQSGPEARTGLVITVINPAGWVEIFTIWFQREGVKMSVDEIGNKKLEQMKNYCEKVANKTGEKIESKNLKYDTDIKSVNRKSK